jgi:hypothetical protein
MLVFATVVLWPLTLPFRALRFLVRLLLMPFKTLLGLGSGEGAGAGEGEGEGV